MKNRAAIYVLICTLSLTQPASADEYGDMFGLMFRMMLSMMDAMSDVAGDSSNDLGWGGGNSFGLGMSTLPMMSGMSGVNPWGSGMSPWGSGMSPWGSGMSPWGSGMSPWGSGMNPWSGPGGMPLNGMGMSPWNSAMTGNPYTGGYSPSMFPGHMNNFYGNQNYRYPAQYASSSLLNGRWFGDSGEILEVRGNQFRLKNRQAAISGAIRVENNIVNLFAKQTGSVTQYTFARNQSDLILQDASGQVLVFRQRPVNRGIRVF